MQSKSSSDWGRWLELSKTTLVAVGTNRGIDPWGADIDIRDYVYVVSNIYGAEEYLGMRLAYSTSLQLGHTNLILCFSDSAGLFS